MKKKFPPFNWKRNLELVKNQHRFHLAMRKLVTRNGTRVYIKNYKRRCKVVEYYLSYFNIIGTSVEDFWRSGGACILIGKDW